VLEQCGREGRRRHAPAPSEGLTSLSENGSQTISEAAASSGRAEGLTPLSERSSNNAKSSRQLGEKHPLPGFNSMAVKDARLLERKLGCGPFARFETPIEQGSKASQAQKRTASSGNPSPPCNTIAVKQARLRAAALERQLGRGPFARFETPIEQGSKASQKAQKRTAGSEKALTEWQ